MKKPEPIVAILFIFVFTLVAISAIKRHKHAKDTVLNLDAMAIHHNATSPYFLVTSNHATLQSTTSYGISTIKIEPRTKDKP